MNTFAKLLKLLNLPIFGSDNSRRLFWFIFTNSSFDSSASCKEIAGLNVSTYKFFKKKNMMYILKIHKCNCR